MGLANAVFPVERLEEETVNYCREILCMSPTALRFIKRALVADTDGLAGMQMFAGDSTLLYLPVGGGQGGQERVPREAPTRLLEVRAIPIGILERVGLPPPPAERGEMSRSDRGGPPPPARTRPRR